MSNKKPRPLIPPRSENRCPVCGEISYSRDGVHPQCSMKRADEQRKALLDRDRAAVQAEPKAKRAIGSWQRICSKCNAVQHVRKKVCSCGNVLSVLPRPPTGEGDST